MTTQHTPWDAEEALIRATRDPDMRSRMDLLIVLSKQEGYRRAKTEVAALLEAAKIADANSLHWVACDSGLNGTGDLPCNCYHRELRAAIALATEEGA